MFNNVRAEMKRRNKTNKDIAELLGISSNSVSFKLNGYRPFTLDEIKALANAFDCTIDYLAERDFVKGS